MGVEPDFDSFYELDADDRIVVCGGPAWKRFAEANNGAALTAASLAGALIYDHVAGHFTKRFLRAFFEDCRAAAEPLRRTYRCDSPRAKRLMEMRATARAGGALRVEHRLVAETPLPHEIALFEAGRRGGVDALRCSMCNRVRAADVWREPEACAPPARPLRVAHTVCPDCRRGVSAKLPMQLAGNA